MFHGTNDSSITPYNTYDLFDRMVARYTREKLDTFLRFYKIPGFGHGRGDFNAQTDWLGALDAWVDKGVAPGASLYAVGVCSKVSTSCSGIALLQGMDFALDPNGDGDISDAVDVLNMSLGSSYGQREDDLSYASAIAVQFGVVVVASAGNSADKPYIVVSPSSTPEVISVAQTQVPSAKLYRIVAGTTPVTAGGSQCGNTLGGTSDIIAAAGSAFTLCALGVSQPVYFATNSTRRAYISADGVFGLVDSGAKPACSATYAGGMWFDAATPDTLEACTKDGPSVYAWRDMIAGGTGSGLSYAQVVAAVLAGF